jgi:hypothetical protein
MMTTIMAIIIIIIIIIIKVKTFPVAGHGVP